MAQDGYSRSQGRSFRNGDVQVDAQAVVDLIVKYTPALLARANRIMRSHEDARDVLQDASLTVLAGFAQLRDIHCFPAWFRAIVDSHCHRHLRKRGKEISLDGLEGLDVPAPDNLNPARHYERLCFAAEVKQALTRLSPPLREVCVLYYEHGLTIEEIADLLAIKRGTVRKRLHSAQPCLSKMLSGKPKDTPIRVGYLPISDHLLGMVAHWLGKGRHSGMQMKRFLSWSVLAEALAQRRIDAAFIMTPLAMQLCNSGTPLKCVLHSHHNGSALAAVTKTLKGKRIGVPGQYATHRVLLGLLARESPSVWNNISISNTNPSYAINYLRRQSIDAFFCAEPWSTKSVCNGDASMILHSKEIAPGHPCCLLAVREDFCDAHAELVNDYVRLVYQARDKAHADKDLCGSIQSLYTGVQSDLAAKVLKDKTITFDNLEPDMERMRAFMNLCLASGVLPAPCDVEKFVCKDFC